MLCTELLSEIYEQAGNEWVSKNGRVIILACKHGLAFGGSIAMAFGHKRPGKIPGDFDFVADSLSQALAYASDLICQCDKYRGAFKVYVQNKTDWVPVEATAHVRIRSTLFMDVCVFVRPGIKFWYPCKNTKVQDYNEVKKSADNLTERDKKERVIKPETPKDTTLEDDSDDRHDVQQSEPAFRVARSKSQMKAREL